MNLLKICSGGQTGADIGALRAAKAAGLPTGGFAAKGWMTEAGPAPSLADYGLVECEEAGYPARTLANVLHCDALLWFGNPHSPGGRLTLGIAVQATVDHYVVLDQSTPSEVAQWIRGMVLEPCEDGKTPVLMVAGNRERKSPGIGARVETFMGIVFQKLGAPTCT